MAEAKSVWRKDTTAVHPLFDGNPGVYWKDSEWRADILRAGAGLVPVRQAGLFADREERPGYYHFGSKN